MQTFGVPVLSRALSLVTAILIVRVAIGVMFEYPNYFPPNFQADFLRGREEYFWAGYQWAFFVHIISGPASLILGTLLVSERLRKRAPAWHRRLGRVQGVCVLLLVAPSGLYMARYAATGAVAAAGLGSLAIATAVCVALGWRAAVQRRFAVHRRWMLRTFVLLCSAVVIRMIGGLASVLALDPPWLYPASTWLSWLAPLAVLEAVHFLPASGQRKLAGEFER
jgi:hypothetical protein